MQTTKSKRNEVILAGSGGQGIVVAGDIIANAAMQRFQYVTGIPVYGGSKRSGLCEATVLFSGEEIASPFVEQVGVIMLLDNTYFKAYEQRVLTGGIIIADTTGLPDTRARDDYTLFAVPALETASGMGDMIVSNMIILGAYVVIAGTLSVELIEDELGRRYGGKGKALNQNMEAFRKGMDLGKSALGRPLKK
ncbi:2-oxoacid:acceptor oxidoreductase family protein [Chloroflexota bacterium]